MSLPLPRADQVDLAPGQAFRPGADPEQWIDQHAQPYRERPSAVLRELIQNASDSLQHFTGHPRFVEIAILHGPTELDTGRYHLVVRDAGPGMTARELQEQLGVLGAGTKRGDEITIGEFGVGFYSVQAVCVEVAIVSRSAGNGETTAWRYVPAEKAFYPLEAERLQHLLATDFENHPRPARRRSSGTSVFLALDLSLSVCTDWLEGASLARDICRDCVLLPTELYVADYARDRNGLAILDVVHKRDLRDLSLTLQQVPWLAADGDLPELMREFFCHALPYHTEDEHPREFTTFTRRVGDGVVSGLFYLDPKGAAGSLELFVKRMRVETAQDLIPQAFARVFGVIDLQPGKAGLRIEVPAARDHVVRNDAFDAARAAVEEAAIEFLRGLGERLVAEIGTRLQTADAEDLLAAAREVTKRSGFHSFTRVMRKAYVPLLRDIPGILDQLQSAPGCQPEVREAVLVFCRKLVADAGLSAATLSPALQEMQRRADEAQEQERRAARGSGGRQQILWHPGLTRRFFARVGPYLSVEICRRENLRTGGFQVRRAHVPLAAVELIDPAAGSGLRILTKGRADDFFVRQPAARVVIDAGDELAILAPALVSLLSDLGTPLEFVGVSKNLFTNLATKDEYDSLVALFRTIVAGRHQAAESPAMDVEARGFVADHVPLALTREGEQRWLVVNVYNDLVKELLRAHSQAQAAKDGEALEIISRICHELYHHAQPAELEGAAEDIHCVETRNALFRHVLALLQKYRDRRA